MWRSICLISDNNVGNDLLNYQDADVDVAFPKCGVFWLQLVKWIRGDAEDQLNLFSQGCVSLRTANQNKAKFDREFHPLAKVR